MSKSACRPPQISFYRGFFENQKGSRTSFQITFFIHFFDNNVSFFLALRVFAFRLTKQTTKNVAGKTLNKISLNIILNTQIQGFKGINLINWLALLNAHAIPKHQNIAISKYYMVDFVDNVHQVIRSLGLELECYFKIIFTSLRCDLYDVN